MTGIEIGKSDVDLFAEEVMDNPYPAFSKLRDSGGVVWLDRQLQLLRPDNSAHTRSLRDRRRNDRICVYPMHPRQAQARWVGANDLGRG
jgi:hypothetical protein